MLGNSLSRSGQRITIAMLAMLTLLALPPTAMAAKTKLIVSRGTEVGHDLVEARFMELNPDIEITVNIQKTGVATQLSAGGEGLLVQLAGGMIPDVAVVADATFGLVAAHGGVEDLTARVVAGDYLKTTWPAAWDAVRLYGRYWGIPYVTDTRAMLYNTEVLAGGGIGHRPTTLEELDAIAHKLTAADSDGKYHQFGFWPFAGNWTLFGWGWLFGGEFVDSTGNAITANDPAVVRALEYEVGYGRRYSWSAAAYPSGLNLCAGTWPWRFVAAGTWRHYRRAARTSHTMQRRYRHPRVAAPPVGRVSGYGLFPRVPQTVKPLGATLSFS